MNAPVEFAALVLLMLAAGGTLAYWAAVGYHVARTMRSIPTARRGLDLALPEPPPRVCVVVPAHNEEACIAGVARSLAGQDYPGLSVVFALDRCTDGTRQALERAWEEAAAGRADAPRLDVLEIDSCPPGWVGKSHAVFTGAQRPAAAEADVLLFVDADTTLDQRLVRACVALMHKRGVAMLSLLSTLTHDRWFEWLVQPAAAMELLRQYPVMKANAHKPGEVATRPFANGQFIMITREAYQRIGTHAALRDAVLEDVEVARRCAWNGLPAAMLLADGLLGCRMYDSYKALRRGWKRIFSEGANRKSARLRKLALRTRLTGAVLPVAALVALGVGLLRLGGPHESAAMLAAALGGLGFGAWLLVVGWSYLLGRTPVWATPGFAVGAWLTGGILAEAARDLESKAPTVWGGIAYTREGR